MSSTPDPHPDSVPQGPDQVTPAAEPGRESVEDVPETDVMDLIGDQPDEAAGRTRNSADEASPLDPPGIFAGTAGTGGENKAQDQDL